MKTLLIDAGNTRIKWGVLNDDTIGETDHVMHADLDDAGLAALATKLPRHADSAFVSNVAGQAFATRLTGLLAGHYDCEVHFAKTATEACGVTNAYPEPRQMGVDRWVAMIGAWLEFGDAVLVVDAGTAVTIDALDESGRHLGGQILPGLDLMSKSLGTSTSDIPIVDRHAAAFTNDVGIFAASTADGVRQGAGNAIAGAIERAWSVLDAAGQAPTVVLTGGDASRILAALEPPVTHRPDLVLAGLAGLLGDER